MKFEVLGQARGKIHNAWIKKWGPNLQRVRHAHPIDFVENVIREVVALIEIQKALQSASFHFFEQAPQSILAGEQIHGSLCTLGMSAVPETVRQLRRKQAAFQKALDLVFKSDAAILDRQLHRTTERCASEKPRQPANDSAIAVCFVRKISGEQLVGSLAAEGHCRSLTSHAGQEPSRQSAGVRAGLVG